MRAKITVNNAQADQAINPGLNRRRLLQFAGASFALLASPFSMAAPQLSAARVWPGTEYTRVTLESRSPVEHEYFLIEDPHRLAIDLKGVDLNDIIKSLPSKVRDDDPVIKAIRAALNRPGVVRVVIELKEEITPQVFTLDPIAEYGHRLVLDLYPNEPADPLMALLRGEQAGTGNGEAATIPEADRIYTVVIDAGHGGEDPGAIGRGGTYEKTVALEIAKRLEKRVEAHPNMRAVMTRKGDYFVPLYERVAIARRAQADMFISIHADAAPNRGAHGSSVYALSEGGATSSAAQWLARRENEADLIGGVNLSRQEGSLARTLLDLSQTATINDSLKLGSSVLEQMGEINRLHKTRVEQAGFAVLRSPDVPSILVETAFISNPDEEQRLKTSSYQEEMADAIMAGVEKYFDRNPPSNSATIARLEN